MSLSIQNIVLSAIVMGAVILGCILLGILLGATSVSAVIKVGNFLQTYSMAIGILSGLWFFFTH